MEKGAFNLVLTIMVSLIVIPENERAGCYSLE